MYNENYLRVIEVDPSDSEADPSDWGVSPFVSNSDVDSASTVLKEGFFVRTIVTLKGERKSTSDSNLSDGDKELDRTSFEAALCLDFFYVPKEEEEGRRKKEEGKKKKPSIFRGCNRALKQPRTAPNGLLSSSLSPSLRLLPVDFLSPFSVTMVQMKNPSFRTVEVESTSESETNGAIPRSDGSASELDGSTSESDTSIIPNEIKFHFLASGL
ncbi:hypothetical protein TorRG33x02_351080 [Trema orientale]|uniref:Uncharacterized protein n=1 Tax=Trema orientale TaxID=63057 RepID=A0A2P5AGB8_TREOI|nr:hypothetical protein TorRG33x02_351080 [Trema orientale]